MVRLKEEAAEEAPMRMLSFNSKVVRLKAIKAFQIGEVIVKFQFQSGAVKRGGRFLSCVKGQLVSIPKWCG